jgi:hypothetical protein
MELVIGEGLSLLDKQVGVVVEPPERLIGDYDSVASLPGLGPFH